MVMPSLTFWQDVPVFLTGHTGFKGSWLALWLRALGARVHGYAQNPPTTPAIFDIARVRDVLASDTRADLADLAALKASIAAARPRIVFHLAAQPLVRAAYADPIGTFATNVMGTAHLLEAVRSVESVEAVVVVTTDKVYDNREWAYPYRETDSLGGHDPYSASKSAAEIVAASFRSSYFSCAGGHRARLATARAGNVIGGGDWASYRLVPDCLKAFADGRAVSLRYPEAVRPWQHVLDPLYGYLLLAEALMSSNGQHFATAWNFGPDLTSNAAVGDVARSVAELWGGTAQVECSAQDRLTHEAGLLRLDASRARAELGWRPRWNLHDALERTVTWHKQWLAGDDMAARTRMQIEEYV
ncbi:MAG TPA: CDP-glucose 4,6-dehydratase [Burkholderiaceae bacterium]|nr:CDP-glucose 4,6-dehydratase [Burkholderiaceae bacterium]